MLIAQPAFPHYVDTDGTPITAGSLYYGSVGANPRTSPVAIYWDAAGTQPAPQPVRTVAGYPVRNGSPANVFINGAYSVALYNAAGELVFYAPDSASFDAVLSSTTVYSRQLLAADDEAEARTLLDVPSNDEALLLSGGTMTGKIVLDGDAIDPLHPTTKQQAESIVANAVSSRMQYSLTSAQSTASGSAVDFTSIPSWAKRLTISFSSASLSGSDLLTALLGTSAGFVTSGYQGSYQLQTIASPSNGVGGNYGVNFALSANTAAGDVRHGIATLVHMGGNLWAISGTSALGGGGGSNTTFFAGSVQLPGVLDRIRFAPNGSNTFDGGSVSLLVEG